jgi:hypothetical protein
MVNPALIINDNPGLEGFIIRGDLTKLLADIDMPLLLISCKKLHQARYTTEIKGHRKAAHPSICMKFCTLTPKIC